MSRTKSQEQPDDRHLAAFHQLNPNPVIGVNSAGSVTFLNDGAKRALESLGKKASPEVLLPEDLGDILAALKRRKPAMFRREVTVGDRVFEESIHGTPEHDAVGLYLTDITERRRAEEELRGQAALLKALVESPTDIIVFALDRNYCYTAFNTAHQQEVKKVYGVDIRTGMNLLDVINIPEVRTKARRSFDRALAGESFTEVEVQPGLGIWYEFSWHPIRAPDGKVNGLTAFIQDTTRRKRTETALAESELKYRRLFESSNDAIMLLDTERFFDCNQATLRVFGCSTRDEFLGKHPADVSPPRQADGRDSRVAADEKMAAALKTGRNYFEWLHQRADGTVFPADVLLTPMDFRGRKVMQATVRDISDRKRAEQQVQAERDRLRRILDAMPDGVYLVGQDRLLQYVNPALLSRGGPVNGRKCYEYLHGRTEPCPDCANPQVFADGTTRREYATRQGVTYDIQDVPVTDDDGRPARLVFLRDITARKRTDEALRQSESKFKHLFEESPSGIALVDGDGGVQEANPAVSKLLGISREDLVGRSFRQLLPEFGLDLEEQDADFRKRLAGKPAAREITFRGSDGKQTTIEVQSSIVGVPGKASGVMFLITDATARKQAEERDRQHLEDTALLRDTAIGFIQLGRNADIYQYVADRLSQLIGEAYVVVNSYDEAADQLTVRAVAGIGARLETVLEVFGRNPVGTVFTLAEEHRPEYASEKLLKFEDGIRGLSYGRLPRALTQTIEKTFDLGGTYAMGFYWQGRILGTLNILMRRGVNIRDPGAVEAFVNQAAIAIQHRRDADELDHHREHLEELVRERTAELEEANRELEAFSYSVSHDLRAPLRAIDGFTQVVAEDCGTHLDAKARAHLDRVSAAARRMSELIDDLLNLARIARLPLERTPVNLSEMARAIAAELRRTAPDRKVKFVIPDGLTAPADPVLAAMVLRNLLSNAWKFTSRHPTARIELGKTHADGGRVLFVRDDGAGFDMAYVDKLFAPFQRLHTDHEFPGSGIGLAIVHRIVQRHGGKVWIEAEVEKGATCRFTLEPATREA
jgi:PAS domain S-box-containing protein